MSFEEPEHDGAAERDGGTQVRVGGERLLERRLARRLQPDHDGVPVGLRGTRALDERGHLARQLGQLGQLGN
jgi:hypothetical protein